MEIYWHIQKHSDVLTPQLEAFATLKAIVEIVHSCPKGFTSYCAISNTVKAIGIGGSASLFVTVKMSSFLADSQEAEARNLVALTRSKGLCLLLFPTTHVHPTGPLHSLRTLCALRHGMFHIGKDRVDLDSFAAFLTQPDTVEFAHDGITIDSRAPFTRESWLFTHQITSYGAWTFLALNSPWRSGKKFPSLAVSRSLQIFSTGRATSWMAFGSHLASASAALSWPLIHSSTCVFLTLSLAPHHNSKSKVGR